MDQKPEMALARKVDAFITAATPKEPFDIPTPDAYAAWLSARAIATFRASILLLDASFVDEATQLARSLFTDGLRLRYLERLGVDRQSALLGWKLRSITETERLMSEAVRLGLEGDPEPVLVRLSDERASVRRYAIRHGLPVPRERDLPTEKVLVDQFDCQQEYWGFLYMHKVVHGTPLVAGHRVRRLEDRTVFFDQRGSGESFAAWTALLVARYALLSFDGLLGVLGRDKPAELAALLQRVEDLGADDQTDQGRSG